ncbi:helix-turn-helix domain-containing protein [Sphingobacterium sp. SYP-B4668]|uniref:helix-turn-helix domain-containing protein n=1 Tax=Sphingobacterium sp. SYP-B4668 TaxID=2996035 RepID=UPI0022DD0F83|nr:helix-turn-helix domain-containing protein [Sphingobacterium sp. SYP-B4668]
MTINHNPQELPHLPILLIESKKVIPEEFYTGGYFKDGILISLCVKGSIEVQANLQNTTMAAGTLLVLLPQSIINLTNTSPDASFISILFRFETISDLILPTDYNFLKTLLHSPVIQLHQEDISISIRYLELLKDSCARTYSVFNESVVKYLLFSLIGQINIFYQQNETVLGPPSKKDKIIFQFHNLVHQHYSTERTVHYYADQLKLTPRYLTTLIRLRTGKTISTVITELVIIKAKSYLYASDLTIYQIAELLHFADASTFCRYFKKYTDLSPQSYRLSTR